MRTDPTDNGGLFVGRRPGTAPVQYRDLPDVGTRARRRVDGVIAGVLLTLQVALNLLFWGPIPAGSLWVASQVQYHAGSVSLGIFVGFAVLLAVLFAGLAFLKRLDHAWVLVRRAAGHDQREGVLGVIFGVCAVVGGSAFLLWLLLIGGLGSMAVSGQA
ncbi:hypothetical protein [Paraconexibacter sp. AEG42_29]|uniref:hypothetical protein n=1 Tax=Paraconexibacter sp. AEG42_29 TaxID=2997339 RepID=UPI00339D8DF8